jgi:minor extracellular serine protease Vpr
MISALRVRVALLIVLLSTASLTGMDRVRDAVGIDAAVQAFNVSGRGVIVAILDRGIDWKNQDFRDETGRTRILAIFDLTDDSGATAPGNRFGMGRIHSREEIDSALISGTDLPTRDAVGHGTTTTSIAAGNGRGSARRALRGVAPEAWIVSVKVTSDGAPAHTDQPPEAAFWRPERIPAAIEFVRDKALQMGLPAVMLLNVGSVIGPADGTSEMARRIDEVVGLGKPGLVFVTGSGDDGGRDNRATGVIGAGETVPLRIIKDGTGTIVVDLWYSGSDRVNVRLQTPAGSAGPFTGPATNGERGTHNGAGFTLYHNGSDVDFYRATNGRREIYWQISGPPGEYVLELIPERASGSRFDAIVSGNPPDPTRAPFNRFANFVDRGGTIWEMASANSNVAPNSFVLRTDYVDIDGIPRRLTGDGPIGDLWAGSSIGPTWDGRIGIDVAAPGQHVMTAYNPKSYWATFRSNLVAGGGTGLYGRASAVSAAAPVVTGVIALMLERNPSLSAAEVKAILQRTATQDVFTGPVPNPRWGYGKLNAHRAVAEARPLAPARARR